jgi:hypothetical protein
MPESIQYKLFQQTNPEYDAAYWRRCKALYSGGKALLADRGVLSDVLPKHFNEAANVYDERCKRAFYINYAGSIVDMITAGLFNEQPCMECEPKADEWYDEWFDDVTPPGGRVLSFNDLLKKQITTALVCKRAWALIELPELGDTRLTTRSTRRRRARWTCTAIPSSPSACAIGKWMRTAESSGRCWRSSAIRARG